MVGARDVHDFGVDSRFELRVRGVRGFTGHHADERLGVVRRGRRYLRPGGGGLFGCGGLLLFAKRRMRVVEALQ